jgi:hypothetical protein
VPLFNNSVSEGSLAGWLQDAIKITETTARYFFIQKILERKVSENYIAFDMHF